MANLKTQRQAAADLGITAQQLQNLGAKGAPRDQRTGRYDWLPLFRWYLQQKQAEAVRKSSPPGRKQAEAARIRKQIAEARVAELALAREESTLVSIEYLEEQVEACVDRLRAKLLNLPGRLAPNLVGMATVAAAQSKLQDAVAEAMGALVDGGEDPELDLGPQSIEEAE